ncbi:hypothetical protein [Halarchaeum nitratireducens]|uniref:DUF8165 domain-containing protein n=1 Tax=Halarchaeum nitratireducens TaxID=489913 RepID=A0A830GGY5_9EURY|nr:hypothetical protein [Halarchaeum nitratireducens]GGN25543.1 hypothetical protein GCM10009021_29490 [Halarchaeum nitratireducens]
MPNGHFEESGASIDYGDAKVLFPVAELDGTILQHRDAELALGDVESENVIVIAPTGLASSYALTQRPLTAIPVAGLSSDVRSELDDALNVPIDAFELIQIGKWTTDSLDHSLAEYTDA